MADGARIVQVLVNLLSNAIKYSPKAEVVSITVAEVPGGVEFSVSDRGCGVPESHQALIFECFQQVSAVDASKGTGLGLPICKLIVEAHHGEIGVHSRSSGGSRFWFRIPAMQKASAKGTAVTEVIA